MGRLQDIGDELDQRYGQTSKAAKNAKKYVAKTPTRSKKAYKAEQQRKKIIADQEAQKLQTDKNLKARKDKIEGNKKITEGFKDNTKPAPKTTGDLNSKRETAQERNPKAKKSTVSKSTELKRTPDQIAASKQEALDKAPARAAEAKNRAAEQSIRNAANKEAVAKRKLIEDARRDKLTPQERKAETVKDTKRKVSESKQRKVTERNLKIQKKTPQTPVKNVNRTPINTSASGKESTLKDVGGSTVDKGTTVINREKVNPSFRESIKERVKNFGTRNKTSTPTSFSNTVAEVDKQTRLDKKTARTKAFNKSPAGKAVNKVKTITNDTLSKAKEGFKAKVQNVTGAKTPSASTPTYKSVPNTSSPSPLNPGNPNASTLRNSASVDTPTFKQATNTSSPSPLNPGNPNASTLRNSSVVPPGEAPINEKPAAARVYEKVKSYVPGTDANKAAKAAKAANATEAVKAGNATKAQAKAAKAAEVAALKALREGDSAAIKALSKTIRGTGAATKGSAKLLGKAGSIIAPTISAIESFRSIADPDGENSYKAQGRRTGFSDAAANVIKKTGNYFGANQPLDGANRNTPASRFAADLVDRTAGAVDSAIIKPTQFITQLAGQRFEDRFNPEGAVAQRGELKDFDISDTLSAIPGQLNDFRKNFFDTEDSPYNKYNKQGRELTGTQTAADLQEAAGVPNNDVGKTIAEAAGADIQPTQAGQANQAVQAEQLARGPGNQSIVNPTNTQIDETGINRSNLSADGFNSPLDLPKGTGLIQSSQNGRESGETLLDFRNRVNQVKAPAETPNPITTPEFKERNIFDNNTSIGRLANSVANSRLRTQFENRQTVNAQNATKNSIKQQEADTKTTKAQTDMITSVSAAILANKKFSAEQAKEATTQLADSFDSEKTPEQRDNAQTLLLQQRDTNPASRQAADIILLRNLEDAATEGPIDATLGFFGYEAGVPVDLSKLTFTRDGTDFNIRGLDGRRIDSEDIPNKQAEIIIRGMAESFLSDPARAQG